MDPPFRWPENDSGENVAIPAENQAAGTIPENFWKSPEHWDRGYGLSNNDHRSNISSLQTLWGSLIVWRYYL